MPNSCRATAKLNEVDPQAWLADVLARLPDHPAKRIDELLPWKWQTSNSPLKPPEQIEHSAVRITRTRGRRMRTWNWCLWD